MNARLDLALALIDKARSAKKNKKAWKYARQAARVFYGVEVKLTPAKGPDLEQLTFDVIYAVWEALPAQATPPWDEFRKTVFLPKPPVHPVQPLIRDDDGCPRFKPNKIVRFLLDRGPFDMNDLVAMNWEGEDWAQFLQLIGITLKGYGQSPFVTDEDYDRAQAQITETKK